MREAVEEGHLLSQAEGGQVRLLRPWLLFVSLHTESLSWFLGVLLLILDY